MLGLAFDPGFADNGRFYVYYSAASPRRSVLSTAQEREPVDWAMPASESVAAGGSRSRTPTTTAA